MTMTAMETARRQHEHDDELIAFPHAAPEAEEGI